MYIDKKILDAIDRNSRLLRPSILTELIREYLELESLTHSELIEKNTGSAPNLQPCIRMRKKKKIKVAGKSEPEMQLPSKQSTLDNLLSAWDWALENFDGTLDHSFVHKIVGMIESARYHGRGYYRYEHLRINPLYATADPVSPPNYVKVPDMMDELFEALNFPSLHPVEKAALVHFHFVRIHPYSDGNGRTSRLLQNMFLHFSGLPPAKICREERENYFGILRRGLRGYLLQVSDFPDSKEPYRPLDGNEKLFYNYIGSQVNLNVRASIALLNRMHKYQIDLDRVKERSIRFAYKGVFESYFRAGNVGIVRLNERGIYVEGDITEDMINKLMEKASSTSKVRYDVKELP